MKVKMPKPRRVEDATLTTEELTVPPVLQRRTAKQRALLPTEA